MCFQSCTGGGCDMECFNSQYYHSCKRSCTGEDLNLDIFCCHWLYSLNSFSVVQEFIANLWSYENV